MSYFFTSESVSEGHPDKVADQISDALLDEFLRYDPDSKVACETLVTTGLVVCAGEVRTEGWVDIQEVVRQTLKKIGYNKAEYRFEAESCGVINAIHEQSGDINRGVDRNSPEEQGAGDQGMMFGYATNEMDNFAPLPIEIAHRLVQELAEIRRESDTTGIMSYLRPDSKSQVTVQYADNDKAERIDSIVVSTQHDEFYKSGEHSSEPQDVLDTKMVEVIRKDIETYLIPRVMKGLPENVQKLFGSDYKLFVNPTGKFVIGGPHGDTGLTGRKIIVDTYGGRGAHGGGAFSGKDPSKVDRSAAYAMRHIAKNMVAAGVADEMLVQVAYAIGVADPVGLYVDTFGTCHAKDANGNILVDSMIARKIKEIFDLKPHAIIERFGLKNPIYLKTAAYGHFGRDATIEPVTFYEYDHKGKTPGNGKKSVEHQVQFFGWELLDYVDRVKKEFGV